MQEAGFEVLPKRWIVELDDGPRRITAELPHVGGRPRVPARASLYHHLEDTIRFFSDHREDGMRLLLINPKLPDSFWSFKWAIYAILPGKRAVNPPLGLATLAALCPKDWQVEIVDENVQPVPLSPTADIIGIGGMGVQVPRQRELLSYYRRRGHHVVVGGAAASLCPETYDGLADTIVVGEAEYIWPEFCRDFAAGKPKALYQETGTVDLADSPVPRFDLLK